MEDMKEEIKTERWKCGCYVRYTGDPLYSVKIIEIHLCAEDGASNPEE